jgi:hypothetical protein
MRVENLEKVLEKLATTKAIASRRSELMSIPPVLTG